MRKHNVGSEVLKEIIIDFQNLYFGESDSIHKHCVCRHLGSNNSQVNVLHFFAMPLATKAMKATKKAAPPMKAMKAAKKAAAPAPAPKKAMKAMKATMLHFINPGNNHEVIKDPRIIPGHPA